MYYFWARDSLRANQTAHICLKISLMVCNGIHKVLGVFFRVIHHFKTSRRFVKEFTATYSGNINLLTRRNDLYPLT